MMQDRDLEERERRRSKITTGGANCAKHPSGVDIVYILEIQHCGLEKWCDLLVKKSKVGSVGRSPCALLRF